MFEFLHRTPRTPISKVVTVTQRDKAPGEAGKAPSESGYGAGSSPLHDIQAALRASLTQPAGVFCAECGVCYDLRRIALFPVIVVKRLQGPEDVKGAVVARIEQRQLCNDCQPEHTDFLLIMGDPKNPDDRRAFNLEEGWLQDVDSEGETQYLVSPEQYSLAVCDQCGENTEPQECSKFPAKTTKKGR